MAVSISGSCLSSLLFKLKNVPGDADGFILGKVYSLQVKNITDSQSTGIKEEKKLCLHSFISCQWKHSFYSRSGHPDMTQLHHILGEKYKDVIGWFSYRKNSSHRVSMMERAVHSRLASSFQHLHNQDFLLCLITEKLVDGSTVHSTEYSFQCWDGRKFKVLESEMLTLPSSMPYQQLPTRLLPPHLTHYNTALKEQSVQLISSEGDDVMQSKVMEELCAAMLQRLRPLEEELAVTSEQVMKVRNEVLLLREAVGVATQELVGMDTQESVDVVTQEKAEDPPSAGDVLSDVPPRGIPPNDVPPSDPSTCLLIDINDDLTESHNSLSCDVSHDPLLTPSLDLLSSNIGDVAEGSLTPTAPTVQHSNINKQQDSSSLQCLSQELF